MVPNFNSEPCHIYNGILMNDPLRLFKDIDGKILGHVSKPLSLSPGDRKIESCYSLAQRYSQMKSWSRNRLEQLAILLDSMIQSQIDNFPDTIFWDLNYFFSSVLVKNDLDEITAIILKINDLQAKFGIHSAIKFRYLHDFTYGFDWARWVAKSPSERQNILPFDLEFLDYLEQRQCELLVLISDNDEKYPQLAHGQLRNPFSFVREPKQEHQLHKELSLRGLIPVPAWDESLELCWSKDFSKERNQLAHELLRD